MAQRSSLSTSPKVKPKQKKSAQPARKTSSKNSVGTRTPKKPSSPQPETSPPKPIKSAMAEKTFDRTPFLAELRAQVIPKLQMYDTLLETFASWNHDKHEIQRVLAVDPGTTNIALALLDLEHNSHWTSKVDAPENVKSHSLQIRYREIVFEQWVLHFRPDVIFIEGIAYSAEFRVAESGKIRYMIERVAFEYGIPCYVIQNSTMRKFIGAQGEGTKSMVRMRVKDHWGVEFRSEDETDAYAIARTGIAWLAGEIEINSRKKTKKK